MADNAVSKVINSLVNEKNRASRTILSSYSTHSSWLSSAIASGKSNFIANNSNANAHVNTHNDAGVLKEITGNKRPSSSASSSTSTKKSKLTRDRSSSICNLSRSSIASALMGGADDMDFDGTDGFGAPIPKANPKRNTILLKDIDPMSMVVKDLRRELRSRGLDGNGLKKDLQARLIKYLEKEKSEISKIRNDNSGSNSSSSDSSSNSNPSSLSTTKDPPLPPSPSPTSPSPSPSNYMTVENSTKVAKDSKKDDDRKEVANKDTNDGKQNKEEERKRIQSNVPSSSSSSSSSSVARPLPTSSSSTGRKEKDKEWAKSEMAQRMKRAKMDKDKIKKEKIGTGAQTSSTIKNLIHKAKEIFSPPKSSRSANTNSSNSSVSSSTSSTSSSSSKNSGSSSLSSAATNAAVVTQQKQQPPKPPPGQRPTTFDKLLKLKKAESMRRDQSKSSASQPPGVLAAHGSSSSAVINANKSNQEDQARARMERYKEVQRQKQLSSHAAANSTTGGAGATAGTGKRADKKAGMTLEDQVKDKLKSMKDKSGESKEDKTRMEREEKKAAMLKKVRDEALQKRAPKSLPPSAAPAKAPTSSSVGGGKYVSRPEDNYDISDREGSDSDSDSEDEAPRKRVPDWARSKELIPALQAQFCDANNRIDPDTIFPEVQSCDLEDIFDQKKSRYSRRTSSGEWSKDQITQGEKITYRNAMGFTS